MSDDTFDDFTDVMENPAAYNAALSELQRDDAQVAIPVIDEPANPFSSLPGGIQINGTTLREIEVRELTGADEERIHKAQRSGDPLRFVATILSCGVESIGGKPAEDLLPKLLVVDRDYALLAIREATYGPEIEYGTVRCHECGERLDVTLETSDIPVRRLASVSDQQFTVSLRKGGKALVRLPRGEDQQAYLEDPELTNAERNSILLGRCVITLTDAAGEETNVSGFESIVRDGLGLLDRNKILDEIANRMPGPRYDEVQIEHDCGARINTPIELVSLFRGL